MFGGRRLKEPRPANGRRERGWAGLAHVSCSDKQSLSPSASVEPAGHSQDLLGMSSVAMWVRKVLGQML